MKTSVLFIRTVSGPNVVADQRNHTITGPSPNPTVSFGSFARTKAVSFKALLSLVKKKLLVLVPRCGSGQDLKVCQLFLLFLMFEHQESLEKRGFSKGSSLSGINGFYMRSNHKRVWIEGSSLLKT